MKPQKVCSACTRGVRLRTSDQRVPWHRDGQGQRTSRKWCRASPRYQPKQLKAKAVVEQA